MFKAVGREEEFGTSIVVLRRGKPQVSRYNCHMTEPSATRRRIGKRHHEPYRGGYLRKYSDIG